MIEAFLLDVAQWSPLCWMVVIGAALVWALGMAWVAWEGRDDG